MSYVVPHTYARHHLSSSAWDLDSVSQKKNVYTRDKTLFLNTDYPINPHLAYWKVDFFFLFLIIECPVLAEVVQTRNRSEQGHCQNVTMWFTVNGFRSRALEGTHINPQWSGFESRRRNSKLWAFYHQSYKPRLSRFLLCIYIFFGTITV